MMTREETTNNGDGVHNDLESVICRNDQSMKQFKPGDIVWIKTRNHCWWPGQVVNEDSVRSKPKRKIKDGVLIRMYGCYEYLYVDPVKCSTGFENMLKQENLSIREAFQRAVEEDLSRMRSGGNLKRKVSDSNDMATKVAPKGKRQKQDKIQIGKEVSPQHPGASSGEVNVQEKKKNELKVKAARGKNLRQDEVTNARVFKMTRSRTSSDQSTEPKGAQKANPKEHASRGASKVSPDKQKQNDVKKERTNKTKVGTPKGKNLKQEDTKEPKHTTTPCTTKYNAPEEPTSNLSERRVRVMQNLGLIAPQGSPYRRNGFVVTASLQ